jgi:hypothetical protein
MNRKRFLLALLALPLTTCCALFGEPLRVGISKVDITPDQPVLLAGYASRKELSSGVHDRLYVRATVFESGSNRIALISIDGIGLSGGSYDFISDFVRSELQVDPRTVFLAATHSHSTPRPGVDSNELPPSNLAYTNTLKEKIIQAVRIALQETRPARIGIATGSSPVGVNRRETMATGEVRLGRNPRGVHDPTVLVMRIEQTEKKGLGLLFNYATHATSLGPRNLLVSGDVFGLAQQHVEQLLGEAAVISAFAGASGDIDPWYRVLPGFREEGGWIPETVLLGSLLGTEVARLSEAIGSFESEARVASCWSTLQLAAKERGSQFPKKDDSEPVLTPIEVNLIAARVGEIGFLGINAEVLTEVGLAIRHGSPFQHTFIITHCNGAAGYLPPRHLYKEGGYEITTSPFAPGAAEAVVKEALAMLYGLHEES